MVSAAGARYSVASRLLRPFGANLGLLGYRHARRVEALACYLARAPATLYRGANHCLRSCSWCRAGHFEHATRCYSSSGLRRGLAQPLRAAVAGATLSLPVHSVIMVANAHLGSAARCFVPVPLFYFRATRCYSPCLASGFLVQPANGRLHSIVVSAPQVSMVIGLAPYQSIQTSTFSHSTAWGQDLKIWLA